MDGVAQRPIEPKHEVLRRLTLDIYIEGELFGFVDKLIFDSISIEVYFGKNKHRQFLWIF